MDEWPYEISPVLIKGGLKEELYDINQNDLMEGNDTGVHDEEGEISIETEDHDVINNHMNVNKTENNWDNFEKVID